MDDLTEIKIYQTFHKAYDRNPKSSWIQPIGVNGYKEEGFISDASGDNISQLNPCYCELTAQYWVWKNVSMDYVGFYHYRRYLNYIFDSTWKDAFAFSTPNTSSILEYLTSEAQAESLKHILSIFDVVIPAKYASPLSIAEHYKSHHKTEHWNYFVDLLKKRYPKEKKYVDVFEMTNLNTVYNIFVMRRPLFNAYCEELFPLLDEIYNHFGLNYDSYNNRYIGFLSERFLNFWIYKNNLNYFETPMLMLD